MNGANPGNFDDPALREALKRACGVERAPDALRGRIEALFSQTGQTSADGQSAAAGDAEPAFSASGISAVQAAAASDAISASARSGSAMQLKPSIWTRSPVRWAAAAAIILIAGGVIYRVMLQPPTTTIANALNPDAVMAVHDACIAAPDHHGVGAPGDSLDKIGRLISSEIHRPVMVPDMTAEGWTFNGAAVCGVGGVASAHFIFSRQMGGATEYLSVFSIPRPEYAGAGKDYEKQTPDHALCGWAENKTAFCMVLSGPAGKIALSDARDLVKRHHADIVIAADVSAGTSPTAALQ